MRLLSLQAGDSQQSSAAPGTTCFRDRGWYFGINSKATLSVSLPCFCSARDCYPVALSMPSANHAPSRTQGITKVLFFKAGPCASCWDGPAVLQGRGGKLLRVCGPPCRPPPPGQPFEGVITVACITWVTADAGWSHLMKPLKNSPFHAWFLLKFCSGRSRPGSQTPGLPHAEARGHCLTMFHRFSSHTLTPKENEYPLSILARAIVEVWRRSSVGASQNESILSLTWEHPVQTDTLNTHISGVVREDGVYQYVYVFVCERKRWGKNKYSLFVKAHNLYHAVKPWNYTVKV